MGHDNESLILPKDGVPNEKRMYLRYCIFHTELLSVCMDMWIYVPFYSISGICISVAVCKGHASLLHCVGLKDLNNPRKTYVQSGSIMCKKHWFTLLVLTRVEYVQLSEIWPDDEVGGEAVLSAPAASGSALYAFWECWREMSGTNCSLILGYGYLAFWWFCLDKKVLSPCECYSRLVYKSDALTMVSHLPT